MVFIGVGLSCHSLLSEDTIFKHLDLKLLILFLIIETGAPLKTRESYLLQRACFKMN